MVKPLSSRCVVLSECSISQNKLKIYKNLKNKINKSCKTFLKIMVQPEFYLGQNIFSLYLYRSLISKDLDFLPKQGFNSQSFCISCINGEIAGVFYNAWHPSNYPYRWWLIVCSFFDLPRTHTFCFSFYAAFKTEWQSAANIL